MLFVKKIKRMISDSKDGGKLSFLSKDRSDSERDEFVVSRKMVALADDLQAGILLTEVLNLLKSGEYIVFEDEKWVTRLRYEWNKYICLSTRQIDRAMTILEKNKELIITRKTRLNGKTKVLLRPSKKFYSKIREVNISNNS